MATDVTASQQPQVNGVDESPISPVDRRNSLEKHLQRRPDAQDLKDRHILLETQAAPYVQLHGYSSFDNGKEDSGTIKIHINIHPNDVLKRGDQGREG